MEHPEQQRGRPRLPLADMAFATVFKVYSGFSSRRFTSELRAAHDNGLIDHVPHFNSVSNYLADEAMTSSTSFSAVMMPRAERRP